MVTTFAHFGNFRRKKLAFFLKINAMINFRHEGQYFLFSSIFS
jgi:hypothetical protein